jgi:ferritin-like metal-binding protein YciE
MRDAGIIAAGQKVEHYEIASYGTLRQFAETLGLNKASKLISSNLDEEKAADEKTFRSSQKCRQCRSC